MTNTRAPDLSSPMAAVDTFMLAWKENDQELQWQCLKKVDPDNKQIKHFLTDAISEIWDRDRFKNEFPTLKEKYYDRYIIRFRKKKKVNADEYYLYFAARRKDSVLRSLPFSMSWSRWAVGLGERILGLYPWYDALSYFHVINDNGQWFIDDWRYYKY